MGLGGTCPERMIPQRILEAKSWPRIPYDQPGVKGEGRTRERVNISAHPTLLLKIPERTMVARIAASSWSADGQYRH